MMITVLWASSRRSWKEGRNILDTTEERASEEGHKEAITIMMR